MVELFRKSSLKRGCSLLETPLRTEYSGGPLLPLSDSTLVADRLWLPVGQSCIFPSL